MGRSNLATRLITAAVAIPLLFALVYGAPAWAWFALVLSATAVGAFELFGMTHPEDPLARALGVVSACAVSLVLYLHAENAQVLLTLLIVVPALGFLTPLWRLGAIETAGLRMMSGTAGPFYLGLLTFLALLRSRLGDDGSHFVVLTLTLAWMADSGGYFAGRFFGRTKLYPSISPKKTREGFAGALAGAALAAVIAHFVYLPGVPLEHALGLGLLSGTLGQLGDLVESLLKRSTSIKDSGSILPGHGGLLDRVDGVLLVAPVVYLYAQWTGRLMQ